MIKKPLLIGLLLSKDDGDIIHNVMTEYNRYFDTIFAIDASSDNSLEIIKSFDKVEYAVSEKELGINGAMLKDGIRQLLLDKIQDEYGYEGWIFPIHSDEMFWGNPQSLVEVAINEKANVLNCLIAHFVLHPDDSETDNLPNVSDRKLHYFMGQAENCGFKNMPGLHYNFFEHMRVIPHGFHPVVTCSKYLVRRHYNQRTQKQLRKRAIDRFQSGWQLAYKKILNPNDELYTNISENGPDFYVTDPSQLITAGAIYSPIQKFTGEFEFSEDYEYLKKLIVR